MSQSWPVGRFRNQKRCHYVYQDEGYLRCFSVSRRVTLSLHSFTGNMPRDKIICPIRGGTEPPEPGAASNQSERTFEKGASDDVVEADQQKTATNELTFLKYPLRISIFWYGAGTWTSVDLDSNLLEGRIET